jgi:hypothetical protein
LLRNVVGDKKRGKCERNGENVKEMGGKRRDERKMLGKKKEKKEGGGLSKVKKGCQYWLFILFRGAGILVSEGWGGGGVLNERCQNLCPVTN